VADAIENTGKRKKGVGPLLALGASVVLLALSVGLIARQRGWGRSLQAREVARAPVLIAGAARIKQVNGQEVHWAKKKGITLALDASLDNVGPGARDAVRSALGSWLSSGAPLPGVSLGTDEKGAPPLSADGVNGVYYAPITIPGHENDLAITVSYMNGQGRIVEADIILNATAGIAILDTPGPEGVDAVPGCAHQFDLESVVAHEMGHFFGLGEDMDNDKTTMFVKTSACSVRKRVLATEDTSVLTGLYASAGADEDAEDEPPGGCGGGSISRFPGGGRGHLGILAIASALAASGVARRFSRGRIAARSRS
jgi:hypothetical protein